MLNITENKGFQLTFTNNLTISVQFGYMNYCCNKNKTSGDCSKCGNAEIAIWDKDDKWYDFGSGGEVKGWVNADEVASWIYKVSIAKDINSINN